jgi:nitroreductase
MNRALLFRVQNKLRADPLGLVTSIPKRIGRLAQRKLAGPASRNPFTASLYFAFLSRRFDREHQAVLAGLSEFKRTNLHTKTSFGGFRRNVHRIEKGLVMDPRRDVFAEGYILETVKQFVSASLPESYIDEGERKWATDVLKSYFDAVTHTQIISEAYKKYMAAIGGSAKDPSFVPYKKESVVPSGIQFEDLRKLFVERRSVRWFEDRPVAQEIVEQAVEAAGWAPTACNRQPYRFHAFYGVENAGDVARLAGGTAGFDKNIQCLIVVVGDLSNYVEERDRHLIYIDASLAAMQLMLALQALGLSTVPINWPDVEEREIKLQTRLQSAPYERPIMMIGVGYGKPQGKIPYSQKKPVHLMLQSHDTKET